MPDQRPFKVGDVVVTSRYVDDCGPTHAGMTLPAGAVVVLTAQLDHPSDLWSATIPATGVEDVRFYVFELAHLEDKANG